MIRVEVTEQDNHPVAMIHIEAELTAATVDEFRKKLALLMGKGVRFFILNMDKVDFVDSTGLGAIISITKRVRDLQGDIKLASMQPSAKKLIEVVRADRYFPAHDTVDDALEAINTRLGAKPGDQ
jgi:anti-sigma B factor antagonist